MALERDKVVAASLILLDEVGLDGLTMRALAKRLAVQAPTLYWHFPSKQALLDQMADAIIAPVPAAIPPGEPPDTVLRSLADAMRRALLSRRDGARVYAGTYVMGENVLAVADIALGALMQKGLDERGAADEMFNIVYYILGHAIEEQGFQERWVSADDGTVAGMRRLLAEPASRRFPSLSRCVDTILASDFDARFRRGVDSWLHGLERKEAAPRVRSARSASVKS
ncbi:tetracycline repressor protein class D [Gluconacetobacter sacchari DSM 12717]|uniref:TetR family transcriptional regulator n=2 Tax=Gluconacetobacter sacchari TaxID=92759 RepID=A0A7W4IFF0_9PROT|nr:TetR/AcrR family transcriptional regulator C-terminal domain-containing protein [Gluconacetobacter sacchari]MBB2161885.1 TetR family transcriptional regulator [Gluconacetobacter sacchari]GBQ22230.1 tetracycline repressor protein class D [Gluconacetobacter sacchari DSM 12717]